jgi:[ribosomal protein S5]-alanine N-acetyltransferase
MTQRSAQPSLQTERLELRPFSFADSARVQALAGAKEVASTTLNIPHPYEDGMAEEWIGTHAPGYESGTLASFAVIERSMLSLVGAVGLVITPKHARAELGYWIGVPFWNRGYATEASRAIVHFGFSELDLNRICAQHLVRNPASGRVMQKLGMTHEGRLRQHFRKWDQYEDVDHYGMLRAEWLRCSDS